MNQLHVTLGAVDKVPLVLVAVEVILTLASVYPSSFTTYFTVSIKQSANVCVIVRF